MHVFNPVFVGTALNNKWVLRFFTIPIVLLRSATITADAMELRALLLLLF